MANLIVAEAAEAEYAAAADWYAERSLAAADGFTEAVAGRSGESSTGRNGAQHQMAPTGS